jgi:hypothetical protein
MKQGLYDIRATYRRAYYFPDGQQSGYMDAHIISEYKNNKAMQAYYGFSEGWFKPWGTYPDLKIKDSK